MLSVTPVTATEVSLTVDGYLTSSGFSTVLGSDGDGGLAGLHSRYFAIGIHGGNFRLVGFPRYLLVCGVFRQNRSCKGFIVPNKNTRFALVEFYTRYFDLFIADDYLTSSGLAALLGGDGLLDFHVTFLFAASLGDTVAVRVSVPPT